MSGLRGSQAKGQLVSFWRVSLSRVSEGQPCVTGDFALAGLFAPVSSNLGGVDVT